MKTNKVSQIFVTFVLSYWANSALSGDVPENLFKITLGGIYSLGNKQNNFIDNLPKKNFAGIKKGFGNGFHYYFQPQIQYKNFPYVEKTTTLEDQYLETSFKLYLLPVISVKTTNSDKLKNAEMQWEVIAIDWSNDVATENDAYHWAMNLCQTYEKKITIQAEITDYPDSNWYECRYSSSNRVLNIGGMSTRIHISLSYQPETIISKEKSVKTKLLELP